MEYKSTDELDKELMEKGLKNLDKYYEEENPFLENSKKEFTHFLKEKIKEKNFIYQGHKMKFKDIYAAVGVSESQGEKTLNMERHTPDRDFILALCIAGRLTIDEINTALKLYEMQPLYSKNKRDACIIAALRENKYNLLELDEILIGYGFPQLSRY